MEIIYRKEYVDRAMRWLDNGMIVIFTGQRRVGKSYTLKQLEAELLNMGANVVMVDKENTDYMSIRTYENMVDYAAARTHKTKHNCLLVDEVQEIVEYERAVRSLLSKGWRIALTGSNAHILSSEISTLLGGRYIEIHVCSLSFNEFIQFHSLQANETSMNKYIMYGGMPHLYRIGLDNTDLVKEYLQNINNTIILKDVISRERIRNVLFLQNLMKFVADNIGKLISATSVSKYMKQENVNITSNVVISYLSFLCNAYILNEVPRFDIHGKRLLETNEKYYFEDIGLRNAVCRPGGQDIEKRIENIIYLHLKRCGYTVYVGQLYTTEIDFVAKKDIETIYVQATYIIANEETREREFGNLKRIADNNSKYVVSVTPMADYGKDSDGIIHIHLLDFLTRNQF
ncbi:MAG: ATP-binding protein [Marinilabiliaceae bacterium]|nr:ATP-binding protein [Marinilabiliaceae bacterium]